MANPLTDPKAWTNPSGTDPRAIADRLMEDVDRDLISRQELELVDRIEATASLARQAMIEVDRMAAAHLANGGTYQQVADALGITRQSAHQRYSQRDGGGS